MRAIRTPHYFHPHYTMCIVFIRSITCPWHDFNGSFLNFHSNSHIISSIFRHIFLRWVFHVLKFLFVVLIICYSCEFGLLLYNHMFIDSMHLHCIALNCYWFVLFIWMADLISLTINVYACCVFRTQWRILYLSLSFYVCLFAKNIVCFEIVWLLTDFNLSSRFVDSY